MSTDARIILELEDDIWIAEDVESGVASQGETGEAALANLDEAVALTKAAQENDTQAPVPDAPWIDDLR